LRSRGFVVLLLAAMVVPAAAAASARDVVRPTVAEMPTISSGALAAAEVARNPSRFAHPQHAGPASAQAGTLSLPDPLAPALATSWDAINFDEQAATNPDGFHFIPPDPNGAAGPSHVVDVVNSAIEWYTKAGVRQSRQSLRGFFSSLAPQADPFDPKVIYDRASNRWLVVALELTDTAFGDPSNTSRILLAASDDNDPNGTWFESAINSALTIGSSAAWADFPGIAVNGNAIFVTANMFRFESGGGSYAGGRLFVADKTSLYAGAAVTPHVYDPFALAAGSVPGLTLQPAEIIGTGPSGVGTYLVGYDGLHTLTSTFVDVIKVVDPLGTPTFTNSLVQWGTVASDENIAVAVPDAPQRGTTRTLDSGDRRVSQTPIFRNGKIYLAAETVPVGGTNAGQATARWWAINESGMTLSETGTVGGEEIGAGTFTLYPSVAVNAAGELALSFAATGPTIHPGSYYTVHRPSEAAGTVEPAGTLRAGTDYYVRTFENDNVTPSRWGDYTGISVDPSNDTTFWVFDQSALARGTTGLGPCPLTCVEDGRWGTAFGKFTPPRQLAVTKGGTGSGSVMSSPTGIDCGSTCTADFDFGTSVTLTAGAGANSTFAGWGGACSGTGTCVVTMDDARSVTATFNLVKQTLTVGKAGTGSGSVSSSPAGIDCGSTCSADFDHGTVVTLTPAPSANSAFAGWSGACSGSGSCQVTMDAAKSVTATFNIARRTLTVAKAGSGSGSVSSAPAGIDCGSTCSSDYDHGIVVTLAASVGANSTFAGWSGSCSGTGSCVVTMDAAKSVTASFGLVKRTLTVGKAGAGSGTVTSSPGGIDCGGTCSAGFDYGAVVTLTAAPDSSSSFAGWGGECSGTGSCNITMDAARSATASFTAKPAPPTAPRFVLTVTTAGTGSGTVTSSPGGINCGATCSATYDSGTVVTLGAAATGSTFTGWAGACSGTGSCSVTMDAAKAVTATFSQAATRAPPSCVVPNVVGMRLAAATRALAKAHCRLGNVTHAAAPRRLRGRVVSERPRRGRKLKNGARVSLVLGRAPRR
jgi:Divergent InlB B-repeat domain